MEGNVTPGIKLCDIAAAVPPDPESLSMSSFKLPEASHDLLEIPRQDIPAVVHDLIGRRSLSALVRTIHGELASKDPGLRRQARMALDRLGFPE